MTYNDLHVMVVIFCVIQTSILSFPFTSSTRIHIIYIRKLPIYRPSKFEHFFILCFVSKKIIIMVIFYGFSCFHFFVDFVFFFFSLVIPVVVVEVGYS